ncbi:MAG: hypothetical protein KJ623_03665 [Nanoarchaeota archaeon]|nr:hypothetical protein [Nanoarchaeota archaeon]MBU0963391.1 hypothetical protein [Nanoarchaeota archaeon]
MKNKISITINEKILRDVDGIVDNLYIRNRSQAFEYLIKNALKEDKVAVILVGEGRSNVPKRLKNRYALKINHLTLIEKAIKKLSDSGFRTIYLIANHNILTDIFKIIGNGTDRNIKIEFINEEKEEGSGQALKLLKGKIKTTFLVVQCDIVFDEVNLLELWQQHIHDKNIATISVYSSITPGNQLLFGYVNLQGNKVISYVEKPTPRSLRSTIFSGGIFVAEPEILNYPGKSLELDIFPELAKRRLLGGQIMNTEHLHIHTHEDLVRVRKKISSF